MSNGRRLANIILGTEVSITNVDSDLANTVSVLKSRLDSDDTKLQSLDSAVKTGFTNLADSDLIVSQLTAKITSVISNLDSDTIALQTVNTKIGLIKSRLDSDDSKLQTIGTELASEILATNTDVSSIKTRLDSDDAKLQSLDTSIQTIKVRLDSDDGAIQTLTTLASQAVGAAGLTDSDLKVVADLRNNLDSEILYVRNIQISYTNYIYNATAGQTSFTGNDANSVALYYTAGSIQVFLNGIKLDEADYTATDGTTIVLTEGALLGHQLSILCPKFTSNYEWTPVMFNWTAATQQAKVSASPNGSSNAGFGDKTDLSGDGNYAVVGARTQSGGGAAYVLLRTGSSWAVQQKLTAASSSEYGYGARINETGDTIIIGAMSDGNKGAAYVYTRSGSTWSQQQKLQPAGIDDGDYFGNSVDISNDGNIIVVGHQYDDVGGTNSGSAYIFTRSGSTWTQRIKLAASNAAGGNQFGHSVAISGDGGTVIIGAPGKTSVTGSAYIFTGSGSSWTQRAEIAASDAATSQNFAYSVTIDKDGNTAAVGSMDDADYTNAGAVYVFTTTNGTSWSQQTKISSPNGSANDQFSSGVAGAVDISDSGYDIIVGAYEDTGNGAAYIFQRSGSTWTQKKRLVASDASSGDRFGWNVGISSDGSTGIVGATNDTFSQSRDGTAYIFTT